MNRFAHVSSFKFPVASPAQRYVGARPAAVPSEPTRNRSVFIRNEKRETKNEKRETGVFAALRESQASMVATLHCTGDKGSADLDVLFDTGASVSFISRAAAAKLGSCVPLPKPFEITIGDGSKIVVAEGCVVSADLGGTPISDTYLILEKSVEDLVVGESTMGKAKLKIDMENHAIYCVLRTDLKPKKLKLGETMKDFLKKLFAKLGISASDDISDDISDDKAIELIAAKVDEKKTPVTDPTILLALGLDESATLEQIKGKILVLQKPSDTVPAADLAALQGKVKEQEIQSVVDGALAEGKLTPAEKDWALGMAKTDIGTFKAFVAMRPKVVPLGTKLPEKKDEPAEGKIDDVQATVNRQMGLSKETFLKYNAAAS